MSLGRHFVKLGVIAAIVVAVVLAIAWWPRTASEAVSGKEIWTCSMHPQVRLPRPGLCPICGMKLIPASQLETAGKQTSTSGRLETATVARRELVKEIRTVGKIDYNESRVEYITARIAGRVDRLYVDFTGVEVKHNDHLVDIYSPELFSAQTELIRALEASTSNQDRNERLIDRFTQANLQASREKLLLWGLLPEQIAELEKTRKAQTHVTIYAPLSGTVIEKNVRLGQYIREGDQLYRIAELDPIWLYLDVYEYDIAWVRYGQPVELTLEAFAGETFGGMVTFIDPFLDDRTRTVRVRVNLKNPEQRLKAGMYASATIRVRLLAGAGPAPTGLEGKYSCPMHPEVIRDQPGKCPICKMDLIQIPAKAPFAKHFDGQAQPDAAPDQPAGQAHQQAPTRQAAAQQATAQRPTPSPTEPPPAEPVPPSADANPLAVPASAVLDTGRRQIAYRATDDGNYELVELQVGPLATAADSPGGTALYYPVLRGLNDGDRVVVRGGFLLDSQTQIEGRPSLLFPEGQSGAGLHSGHGSMPMPPGGEHKH